MMQRHSSESNSRRIRATAAAIVLGLLSLGLTYILGAAPVSATGAGSERINNNRPAPNPGGAAATFSTQGSVNLTSEYFQAQGTNGRSCATGETRQLSDAGRGNVTGLWNDLGRFKTPSLRALAARAPYFHNGTAATLEDVVQHYELFLGFTFTPEERADLVAFLKAL